MIRILTIALFITGSSSDKVKQKVITEKESRPPITFKIDSLARTFPPDSFVSQFSKHIGTMLGSAYCFTIDSTSKRLDKISEMVDSSYNGPMIININ